MSAQGPLAWARVARAAATAYSDPAGNYRGGRCLMRDVHGRTSEVQVAAMTALGADSSSRDARSGALFAGGIATIRSLVEHAGPLATIPGNSP